MNPRWVNLWQKMSGAKHCKRRGASPNRRKFEMERLEDRNLLAVIAWNSGNIEFDNFGPSGNPTAGRAVVNAAIDYWAGVIDSFNYSDGNRKFDLEISVQDLDDELARMLRNSLEIDETGKPYRAKIEIDRDAAGAGWFFDTTPYQDEEFTATGVYEAVGALGDKPDLYSTVLHEIGHALGFSNREDLAIQSHLLATPGQAGDPTFVFDDGSRAYMTLEGGLHWLDLLESKDDLMVPSTPGNARRLISDLDARALSEAYGYTFRQDVLHQHSFVTSFDANIGELTIHGDLKPLNINDEIRISRDVQWLYVSVNGIQKKIWADALRTITVNADAGFDKIYLDGAAPIGANPNSIKDVMINAGDGSDEIYINSTAVGQDITIETGWGFDKVLVSERDRNLGTIQSQVRIVEQGETTATLYDTNNRARRELTISSNTVTYKGSSAEIKFGGSTVLSNLVIEGGSGNDKFIVEDQFDSTSTHIFAGKGNDEIEVRATTGLLTVGGEGGGTDTVTIGSPDPTFRGMSSIKNSVQVSNEKGYVDLILDDSGFHANRTDARILANKVTGLAPAEIGFVPKDIKSLRVRGGASFAGTGNVFTVEDTVPVNAVWRHTDVVTIEAGVSFDVVNVWKTTSNLVIDGQHSPNIVATDIVHLGKNGSMQQIAGRVKIVDADGSIELMLDDSSNVNPRQVRMALRQNGDMAVNGLAPGEVWIQPNALKTFEILGGDGDDSYTIETTPRNATNSLVTMVNTGNGKDTAQIRGTSGALALNLGASPVGRPDRAIVGGSNSSLDPIQGKVTILGDGTHSVDIYDNKAKSQHNVFMTSTGAHRAGAGDIDFAGALVADYFGGGFGDTYTIEGRAATQVNVTGGSGGDIFQIGIPGAGTIDVGNGYNLNGGGGGDTLFLDDNAAGQGYNYFLTSKVFLGLGLRHFITRQGVTLNHASIEAIDLATGDFVDTFELTGGVPGNMISIHAGESRDIATVRPTRDYTGVVKFDGENGADEAIYDDTASAGGQTFTVAAGSIERAKGARLEYVSVDEAKLNAGSGTDIIKIQGSLAGVNTNVNSGDGIDTFEVGNSFDAIQGALSLIGGNQRDKLRFDDETSAGPQYYAIYSDHLERMRPDAAGVRTPSMAPVSFTTLEDIELKTSGGGVSNAVDVYGVTATNSLKVRGNASTADLFAAAADQNALLGELSFFGAGAGDLAYYYDYFNANPYTYNVRGDATNPAAIVVDRDARSDLGGPDTSLPPVIYQGINQLILLASAAGGNAMNVSATPAGTFLSISASNQDVVNVGQPTGGGSSTLSGILGGINITSSQPHDIVTLKLDDSAGPLAARTVTIAPPPNVNNDISSVTGLAPSTIGWRLSQNSPVSIRGSAANETFEILEGPLYGRVSVNGGGGQNALSYATWTNGMVASLSGGVASALAGGIANFQHVFGGAGGDLITGNDSFNILLGGGGIDTLDGRLGRNLLVGGTGPDTIEARNGAEDIVLGGRFSYYDETAKTVNREAVDAIFGMWAKNIPLNERIDNLQGANGFPFPLDTVNVFDDLAFDSILSDANLDWVLNG